MLYPMQADSTGNFLHRRKYLFALLGMSMLVAGSLTWNINQENQETLGSAVAVARANISKDISFRKWVASHGGVYVPPSARTPPNPYLLLPERDVITTMGKPLTLMNPAYALREMQHNFSIQGTKSHITSLKPLNPANAADAWEAEALSRFEHGILEVIEQRQIDGQPYLRLMRPFIVEQDCLKCHALQGYKIGDIRGGISTAVSMSAYLADEKQRIDALSYTHGLIWLIGMLALYFSYHRELALDGARRLAQTALLESKNQLRLLLDSAAEAIYGIDIQGNCTFCNPSCLKMLGYHHQDELNGKNMHALIHYKHSDEAPYVEADCHIYRAAIKGEASHRDDEVFWHADGSHFPVEYWSYPQIINGKVVGAVVTFLDISLRKESEEKLWNQANFDPLTGLPNRRMIHDRMQQELKKSQRSRLPLALMLIDLDHFKEINDTLGHDMGDLLLVETARRIVECIRHSDTVARLGGDEFIVILPELDDISNAEKIATSIVQQLASPFILQNQAYYVTASIGITLYPDDASNMEELFKNADQAMYVAKSQGRNCYSYFTSAMQQSAENKLELIDELRSALPAGQFLVYFQPIVELATGRINKAEALLRWQHPERGLLKPADFMALAEESGLIYEIGDWAFHEAMGYAKRWRALYTPLLQISVNKSPVQFYKDGDEQSDWLSWLLEQKLPGKCLAIEITESLLLNSNAAISSALITLRNADIQVSIDDFGTGYSSLANLKKFDIDYFKIDQSFIRNLHTDPNDLALSEAIILMAHKLGIKVIAEGVENIQQRDLLVAAGCDYAQGYYISMPLPAKQFEELLKKQK